MAFSEKSAPTNREGKRLFPRYHGGAQVSALVNGWQSRPECKITFGRRSHTLQFSYRFRLPRKLRIEGRKRLPALFGFYRKDIKTKLRNVLYEEARSKLSRSPVAGMTKLHHHVIERGFRNWFEQMCKSTPGYSANLSQELREFDAGLRKRTGPDVQRAFVVKERFDSVRDSIKRLRKCAILMKLTLPRREEALIKLITREKLRVDYVRRILQKHCGSVENGATAESSVNDGAHAVAESKSVLPFFNTKIGATELARAYVSLDLQLDKNNPLRISVPAYVKRAKKLLRAV